jgi:hypothetical protein
MARILKRPSTPIISENVEKMNSHAADWEYNMVQPPWKTVCQFIS